MHIKLCVRKPKGRTPQIGGNEWILKKQAGGCGLPHFRDHAHVNTVMYSYIQVPQKAGNFQKHHSYCEHSSKHNYVWMGLRINRIMCSYNIMGTLGIKHKNYIRKGTTTKVIQKVENLFQMSLQWTWCFLCTQIKNRRYIKPNITNGKTGHKWKTENTLNMRFTTDYWAGRYILCWLYCDLKLDVTVCKWCDTMLHNRCWNEETSNVDGIMG
jgi:hypothetical protein